MSVPAADKVREYADLQVFTDAADLLDAIDAEVARWDGYNGDDVAVAIKLLLHPEDGGQ